MRHIKRTLLPIGTGLMIAQLIATGFVYLSNLDVHQMVLAAQANGYVAIPYGQAAAVLTAWRPAILGGLFYTLSIGVGLTLIPWALWHLWHSIFQTHPPLIVVIVLLSSLIVLININGPTLFPTLFCLLVPLGTLGSLSLCRSDPCGPNRLLWIIPAVTLGLLAAMWATQLNQNLFIAIRDHLLLSNPAGRAVNDFYYRYTLFAAQSFKSVYQKTLRTYHLEGDIDERQAKQLKTRLLSVDMLHLPQLNTPDMTVGISKHTVVLTDRYGRRSEEKDLTSFLNHPGQFVKSFSHASDRYRPLRRMTLYGLLFGFPIVLFVGVYTVVRIGMERLCIRGLGYSQKHATFAASLVCLIVGIALYWPMHVGSTAPLHNENLPDALTADAWPMRVAALRYIETKGLELADYPQYRTLLTSTMPVERYWLARALAASRCASTFTDLISLVQDHHPNVQCQVYYALGERGNRKAIQMIKAHMFTSDHWYIQWYGYRALRRLGWHQALSDS